MMHFVFISCIYRQHLYKGIVKIMTCLSNKTTDNLRSHSNNKTTYILHTGNTNIHIIQNAINIVEMFAT